VDHTDVPAYYARFKNKKQRVRNGRLWDGQRLHPWLNKYEARLFDEPLEKSRRRLVASRFRGVNPGRVAPKHGSPMEPVKALRDWQSQPGSKGFVS
jgi:hypothetical protein